MPNCCAIDDILYFLSVCFKFLAKIEDYFELKGRFLNLGILSFYEFT